MEIDGFDEFEMRYQLPIDLPLIWNGREISSLAQLKGLLHETICLLASKLTCCRFKSEDDAWKGSKRCIDFYLSKKLLRPVALVKAAAGSLALSDSEIPKFSSFELSKLEIPFVFPILDFSSVYPQSFAFYQPVFNGQSFVEFDQTKFFNASQLSDFFSGVGTKLGNSNTLHSLAEPLRQSFSSIPLNPAEFPSLTVAQYPQYFSYFQQSKVHEFEVNIDSLMKSTQNRTDFNFPTNFESMLTIASCQNADKLASISAAQSKIASAQEAIAKAQAAIHARTAAESIPMPTTSSNLRCGQIQVDFLNWQANIKNAQVLADDLSKAAFQAINEAGCAINTAVSSIKTATPSMETAIQLIAGAAILAAGSAGLPLVPQVLTLTAMTNFVPRTELETSFGAELASNLNQKFSGPPPGSDLPLNLPSEGALPIPGLFEGLCIDDPKINKFLTSPFPEPLAPKYPEYPLYAPLEKYFPERSPNSAEVSALAFINQHFKDQANRISSIGPFNNYASTLAPNKPESPFQEIPYLGFKDQSTIHFHCGINNNFPEIVEAGLCLHASLNKEFGVQPHLIHSHNIAKGLIFVFLESQKDRLSELKAKGVPIHSSSVGGLEFTLENSKIQEAIEYEVATFSQIAERILGTGNPNLKQVHIFFSNGGYVCKEALKQLPPEYRDTVIVITAGTTAIIEDGLAHKAYNVIGDLDWASQTCNGDMKGIEKAIQEGANVILVPQTETQPGIGGHYFMQPEYQMEISSHIGDIEKKYEIF